MWIGDTAQQGHNVPVPAGHAIALLAEVENTGTVYIGRDNTVTVGNGYPLRPGSVILLKISNLNTVWFIADAIGQTIRYIVEAQ